LAPRKEEERKKGLCAPGVFHSFHDRELAKEKGKKGKGTAQLRMPPPPVYFLSQRGEKSGGGPPATCRRVGAHYDEPGKESRKRRAAFGCQSTSKGGSQPRIPSFRRKGLRDRGKKKKKIRRKALRLSSYLRGERGGEREGKEGLERN